MAGTLRTLLSGTRLTCGSWLTDGGPSPPRLLAPPLEPRVNTRGFAFPALAAILAAMGAI
jgi:hypothetical protein